MPSQSTITAFLYRVDLVDNMVDLADVQQEFTALCQALPDDERLQFISDYAERLKAKGRTTHKA